MGKQVVVRWLGYIAIAIVFAIVCVFLSNWQFSRNAERTAANALIADNYDAKPVPLDDVLTADGGFDRQNQWQPVTLRGSYLPDKQLAARNRPLGGSSAFEVLVPFQLEDGRILVIDRGWVPAGENSSPAPIPAPPNGTLTVVARLKPSESLPSSGRSEAPPGQVPSINLPVAAKTAGIDVITSAYGLMASESPAPSARPMALAHPEQDPGPHLSYAIQWIIFAVMGFVFIAYMIRTERKHRREEREDAEALARGEQPVQRVRKRRKDRDADEEDALLGTR